MTLLERLTQLSDTDRVELLQWDGKCWQVSSYPARELKGLLLPLMLPTVGKTPSQILIPEPDPNTPPDYNS